MRIREGDPLEIYTSKEGEVIFKKYSLIGDIDDLAGQFCEALSKNVSGIVAVTDRDTVISGRRRQAQLLEKRISVALEKNPGGPWALPEPGRRRRGVCDRGK